jgi:hypothetical protein
LQTTIVVFVDQQLDDSNCSMKMHLKVCDWTDEVVEKTIDCWYELAERPSVKIRIANIAVNFAVFGKMKYF